MALNEGDNFEPSPEWKGVRFNAAEDREVYRKRVYTSSQDATEKGKGIRDVLEVYLTISADTGLALIGDHTDSMQEALVPFVVKFPLVADDAKIYLGTCEVCVGVVGDSKTDGEFTLQIRPFCKGRDVLPRLDELVYKRGGGGGGHENYEYAALYFDRNVRFVALKRKPIIIFVCDERPYVSVSPSAAKNYALVDIPKEISTKEIFASLTQKYAAYLIHKPYWNRVGRENQQMDDEILETWESLIGKNHIAILGDPERAVDVCLGILAQEAGMVDYFHTEIEARQRDRAGNLEVQKVLTVCKALENIHGPYLPAELVQQGGGKSITYKPIDGQPSKPLL